MKSVQRPTFANSGKRRRHPMRNDDVSDNITAELPRGHGEDDGGDLQERVLALVAILPHGDRVERTFPYAARPGDNLLTVEANIVDYLYNALREQLPQQADIDWKVYRRTETGDRLDERLTRYARAHHKVQVARSRLKRKAREPEKS